MEILLETRIDPLRRLAFIYTTGVRSRDSRLLHFCEYGSVMKNKEYSAVAARHLQFQNNSLLVGKMKFLTELIRVLQTY